MKHTRKDTIIHELSHHMPFTLFVSVMAGLLVGIFYLTGYYQNGFMESFFKIAHPAHILVSAAATAAIYNKYKKSFPMSLVVGFLGALIIGTLSDVLLPWTAGVIFGLHTNLHLPFIEEPILVFGAAIVGSFMGKSTRIFKASHTTHVFLSVFASLAYLLAFSFNLNLIAILLIVLIVFFVVYIPCCISDIVFPILFIRRPCKDCGHWHD